MRNGRDYEIAQRRSRARVPPETELVPPWQAVDWQVVAVLVFLVMCLLREMIHANTALH
jgi:hypothetical protein